MVDWATYMRRSGTTYQLNSCVSKLAPGPYDGHARRTIKSTLNRRQSEKLASESSRRSRSCLKSRVSGNFPLAAAAHRAIYRKSRFSGCRGAASVKLTAMKCALEIREGLDGFVVHVKQSRNSSHILLAIAASVVALYFFWRTPEPRIVQVLVACVILLLLGKDVLSKWRGADVELCVTNLDLISTGRSPSDYRPSTISRADIYDLQYREAQHGGGEFPDLPEGLYVEYSQGMPWDASACVLPHVGKEQTEEIIQKIMDRFPDTGTLAIRPSKSSQSISLNLNVPTNR
jgi:hypothetical protein